MARGNAANTDRPSLATPLDRRQLLYGLGATVGSLALTSLLSAEEPATTSETTSAPHFAPRAKRCIFLMMEGGPSAHRLAADRQEPAAVAVAARP